MNSIHSDTQSCDRSSVRMSGKQKPSGNHFLFWFLGQLWQMMQDIGSASDLEVWQSHSRSGQTYWHVYDRTKNHSQVFGSENELRIWIEKRH